MMKRLCYTLVSPFLLLILLFSGLSVWAEEVNYLKLASLLAKNGEYSQAAGVLAQVDLNDEDVDKAQYYSVKGIIEIENKDFMLATKSLRAALAHLLKKPSEEDEEKRLLKNKMGSLYVYLGQAFYGLKDYKESIRYLEKAQNFTSQPQIQLLKAACFWKQNLSLRAWQELHLGQKQYPNHIAFRRQKTFYAIELGLFQSAKQLIQEALNDNNTSPMDLVLFGQALRAKKQSTLALSLLESARLLFPDSSDVLAELGLSYVENNQLLAAATLFERAAQIDRKYIADAAELYRRAGRVYQAQYLNTKILNEKERIKQKMALYLQKEQFGSAISLKPSLKRLGLLENQDMKYAMAFIHFRLGDLKQAKNYLDGIQRPDLFKKSLALRQALLKCRQAGWSCF